MSRRQMLARIKRMLDRALKSPHDPQGCIAVHAGSVLDDFFASIERFVIERGWSSVAIRAATMAFAKQAPLPVLKRMARLADNEIDEIEHFDAVGWYQGQGFAPLFGSAAEARRWAS